MNDRILPFPKSEDEEKRRLAAEAKAEGAPLRQKAVLTRCTDHGRRAYGYEPHTYPRRACLALPSLAQPCLAAPRLAMPRLPSQAAPRLRC